MTINNLTLMKIAAIGGFATVTMGMMYENQVRSKIRKMDYYQEALKLVRSHRPSVELLGEPIKEGKVNIYDTWNNTSNETFAHFQIPVKGTKQRGTLYFWAERPGDKWNLTKVELGLDNVPDKRLTIQKAPETDPSK